MLKNKTRLNADDWLQTGFDALVEQGPQGLKAEPLARRIGATKGSFYWHFRDLPDFHARLLAKWEERTLLALAATGQEEADAVKRLDRLGSLNSDDPAEQAIRAWGQDNPAVAETVARVDGHRRTMLSVTLDELDLTNPEFARIVQGAHMGLAELSSADGADNSGAMSTLLAALLALRDA
ncbi:TetR/AcrR family transcriptional regulator [Aliiroseovarius sp.]|uniref:TetR/AcrR family transcriptional regulator n=1 Tax=Aliiroseovarius sp. TaxID=1872442 RepID=UPI0026282825|nr:TetR/AcrR family transcriptional regulator [Aliiroseovarius sp.]